MKFYKSGVRLVLFLLSVLLLASCGESAEIPPIVTGEDTSASLTAPENPAEEETEPAETAPEDTVPDQPVGTEPVIVQKALRMLTAENFEQGTYSYGNKADDTKQMRNIELIPVTKDTVVTYDPNGMALTFRVLSAPDASEYLQKSEALTESGAFKITADGYLVITASKDGTEVSAAEYAAEISIKFAPKIYRFGGEGNDWCFVYLPPDYDPNRDEPYPFVICNHGNGWTMDGTIRYANWTKRTMYVPLDDPDYVRDPANYNGTNDASLWYSNPTIEALLGAGYIVAGCENYGDNLYGNDNCRSACADFFWHMTETYNVEDSCYMIGASNGAMTTLNASFLLGERVKAVILQYPLCCLTNQYFGHADHQGPIRTAYGITDTALTEEEFLAKIGAEFDPLYANVEDGVKQGYFPAVKIYFSTTDVTTKATLNAMPLCKLLQNSGKAVELVRVDQGGQTRHHGDYAHFDPAGYLKFFEAHK